MIDAPAAGPIATRGLQKAPRARTLLAFTGVAPLGAFVLVHLATTATALWGGARFERVFTASAPLTIATIVLVVLPLLFHAGYGAWIAVTQPQSLAAPTWWSRTRRAASLVALVFVLAHVAELALPRWTGAIRAPSLLDLAIAHQSSTRWGVPFVALGYLVGLAATLFHLATSMWTFLLGFGLVVGRRRALAWGLGAASVLLFLVGMNTIVYLATGNRLFGPSAPALQPDGPPPPHCG